MKGTDQSTMDIRLTNITKNYGEFAAIKGVTLTFEEGKFYGLLGPNGAGKTTLFNLLIQATQPTSGAIAWEIDGKKLSQQALYQHVGVVFQTSRLDAELTVEENLMSRGALYGLSKQQVLQRLSEIDVYLHIMSLRKQKYRALSGGQQRKIDIARALLHKPAMLLLDEPTTGLDPKSRHDLWQAIYDLNKKAHMTVVLITHYLEEMAKCDALAVLLDGRVHYDGDIGGFIAQNAEMSFVLRLKKGQEVTALSPLLQEKREILKENEIIYRAVDMREIMDVIADNNARGVIDEFEVQYATLEVAYLNLLARLQGEEMA